MSTVGDNAVCMLPSATLLLTPLQLQRLRPTSLLELLNVVLQLPADFQVGFVTRMCEGASLYQDKSSISIPIPVATGRPGGWGPQAGV